MSKQKEYWNNRTELWLSPQRIHQTDTQTPIIEYILNTIDTDNILLDIGTGTGRDLHFLKDYKKVYGIDFIPKFIENANKIKPANCQVFVDDIVDLKFDKKVDIVFTETCLQHINPDQIKCALNNIKNLQPHNIILWECTSDTLKNNKHKHNWGHNYVDLLDNYKLHYSYLYTNNITCLLHFKRIDNK